MGVIARISKRIKYAGVIVLGSVDTPPRLVYEEIRKARCDFYLQKGRKFPLTEYDPERKHIEVMIHSNQADSQPSGLVRLVWGSRAMEKGTVYRHYLFFEQEAAADRNDFYRYVTRVKSWPGVSEKS